MFGRSSTTAPAPYVAEPEGGRARTVTVLPGIPLPADLVEYLESGAAATALREAAADAAPVDAYELVAAGAVAGAVGGRAAPVAPPAFVPPTLPVEPSFDEHAFDESSFADALAEPAAFAPPPPYTAPEPSGDVLPVEAAAPRTVFGLRLPTRRNATVEAEVLPAPVTPEPVVPESVLPAAEPAAPRTLFGLRLPSRAPRVPEAVDPLLEDPLADQAFGAPTAVPVLPSPPVSALPAPPPYLPPPALPDLPPPVAEQRVDVPVDVPVAPPAYVPSTPPVEATDSVPTPVSAFARGAEAPAGAELTEAEAAEAEVVESMEPVAIPAFGHLTPTQQLAFPAALDQVAGQVAAQVAAEHADRHAARAAVREAAEVAPQPDGHAPDADEDAHEVLEGVLEAETPESLATGEDAPNVGIVFADGTHASLVDGPDGAALQQVADVLTGPRTEEAGGEPAAAPNE